MSAASPYTTEISAHQSPRHTPSRRALADLVPRAVNASAADSSDAALARSPLKKLPSHIPSVFADKENLVASPAPAHGKKRRIEEVEDAEKAGNGKMLAHAHDQSIWHSGMRLTTDAVQRHTENNPVGPADAGSPTERNTPTPEPEPMQDSQKSNQSFSDFLNYELCASQKSEHAPVVDVQPAPTTSAPVEPKKSRAEIMRTRLKFALYKVQTKQERKRGKDIISSFEANSSPSTSMDVPNITISSPPPQPLFVKANLDPFRPIGKLGQPPVQFAIPKDIYGPPPSSHTQQLGEADDADIAERAHERLQRLKEQSYQAGNALSSAGQGKAAVGLMELMSGRR
ncbi:hypothetical protein ACEQ8H_005222 [Pleosporales sp. CAS-2024a]